MFDSLKSGAVSKSKTSPSVFVQQMAKSGSYQQQQQSKQKQFTRQQSSLQQVNQQPPKHHLETNVDIHDTNDIRYSRSNTQVQLQRLSLSASLIDIYFGRHYRSPDVLVVAGLTMILIGLGAILIGVYVYFNEDEVRLLYYCYYILYHQIYYVLLLERRFFSPTIHAFLTYPKKNKNQNLFRLFTNHIITSIVYFQQFQEMTFLVGFAMAGIGFICCSCRIILFGPPLFNCCLPIKTVNYNRERRPTNPPFFTAASSAMSTVTCIGVRFNSGRSLSGVSHVIHINKVC